MGTFLKYAFTTLLMLILLQNAQSQGIILDFANRKVAPDGMSWSFDLMAKGDANYGAPDGNLWIACNIRLDLELPAGVTITGGKGVGDPTYASASIGVQVGVFVPGPVPANNKALGLTIERADSNTDINTSTFVKWATYTINFSAPVAVGNPATPRPIPDNLGSSWSNLQDENAVRPFFFVDDNFTLPVNLVTFTAETEKNSVQLAWSTTEESNSDHFDIERSKDGKKWSTIQAIKALGESNVEHFYSATDNDPLSGQNFYRLHMVDKDGRSAYSRIRNVNFDVEQTSFYPNPVTSELRIKTPDFSKVEHISIVNTSGMKVYQSGSKTEETIDVSKFNSGVYVVRLKLTNGEESNYKIVVSK